MRPYFGLLFLSVLSFTSACSRQEVRSNLEEAKQEMKEAGRDIKRDSKEAGREIRQETREARRDADANGETLGNKAGKAAYRLKEESKVAAEKAARALKNGAREVKEGWNDAKQQERKH